MTSIEDVRMKRAFDAFENAAAATGRVVEVADKWADRLCGTGTEVPLSRLSPNLNPEDSKQFGMLRRVATFVDAVKTTAEYADGTAKIVSAYERLLKVVEAILGQRQMPESDAAALANLKDCCARLRDEFRRKGCSAESVGIVIEDFISSFEPICAAVRRCEDTLLLPGSQATNTTKADAEAVMPPVFARLYGETCFSRLGNDDSKLRMGLSALAEYVRECISKKETRLFGCPMFIRTVYEIDQTKVASIRIAESEEAEGLWTDFKNKLVLALDVLHGRGLVGTAPMKSWLQDCGDVTGQAGSYRSYRRIRHEVLDGLLGHCRDIAILNHADCKETIQMLHGGIFDDIGMMPPFLPISTGAEESAHHSSTGQSKEEGVLLQHGDSEAIIQQIGNMATAQANRIIKAVNKGLGVTNSLIKHTWGEADRQKDKRKPLERKRIDDVVKMFVRRHEMEGNSMCSLLWCCKQVLKSSENGRYNESEVKKLHNAATYDMQTFYDMSAIRAELESKTNG